MINLSECFSMIGDNDCIDVASSLGMMGIDQSMQDICIPIYGPFSLKILIGQECGFLCSSIPEFTAIRQLNINCGTVTFAINLFEIDALSLVGGLLTYTPNTGMNCFLKLNAVDLANMSADMLQMISDAFGIPLPPGFTEGIVQVVDIAGDILQEVFDRLIDTLNNDLLSNGIEVREWEEIPYFYDEVRASGEMIEMKRFRQQMQAFVL